jgi:predicted CoA-binding protein
MEKSYRMHFETNQVAIVGYSPTGESNEAARDFIQNGYHVRLVNPNRVGEIHLGRTVLPSVHSIGPDTFFATLYRNPANASSEGIVSTLIDAESRG